MHNLEGKLTWRKSTRKVASEYNMLPAGVLESDYDINVADVPDSVVIAMLQKQINHIYNNESISGWLHLTHSQLFHVEHPVEAQPSVNNHGCLP